MKKFLTETFLTLKQNKVKIYFFILYYALGLVSLVALINHNNECTRRFGPSEEKVHREVVGHLSDPNTWVRNVAWPGENLKYLPYC